LFGPYHLILESVGGQQLAAALTLLDNDGECVVYGTSASPQVTLDVRDLYSKGAARLYGFLIFYQMQRRPPSPDLGRLAGLVAEGALRPFIAVEAPWEEIGRVAQQLNERRFTSKAVIHVGA
jgi:NADPH:quinone reductase